LLLDVVLVQRLHWGAVGAAVATDVAEWGSAAALVYLLAVSEGDRPAAEAATATGVGAASTLASAFVAPPPPLSQPLSVVAWFVSAAPVAQAVVLLKAALPVYARTCTLQLALAAAAALAARASTTPSALLGDAPSSAAAAAAAAAAHHVLASLWLLGAFCVDAVAAAAAALVATARGAGDRAAARATAAHAVALGTCGGAALGVALCAVRARARPSA
jgi:Na+-driven multidrug efflux pump